VPDEFGFLAGAKGISEGYKSGKEAGKIIGASIEDAQKEAISVAQKQAQDRIRARREAELKKERALIKALEEWKRKKQISDEEARLKIDFVKKYGAKEWSKVLELKAVVEKEHQESKKYYGHKLEDVRRVQFWCWFVAFIITSLLFYFDLV